ncbi:Peptidyl-arginine deiminase Porphyromonas-type [Penicillium capsulatum]|uniref:Peptidyl-arginine deiminase Porphyromonas-type n=1 Tax=Penicillium capsulatum TaxID=69766 RepID=A0A9W9LQT2_9EURO|nr:Peptidyl-arginine deiminase Porphyromonas-type [Penicillium capsulatum]KAJ6135657.1 Peptidyl-arginine deiminase Porphyromonas-type [Penicillium capsulatum]
MSSTHPGTHAQHQPQDKYVFLPETTPHRATILGFPSRCSTFPGLHERTATEIIDLAGAIAAFEPVRLHVRPEDQDYAQNLISTRLGNESSATPSRITLIPCATNHVWVRDTGPVYVRRAEDTSQRAAIDFGFCEWGNKIDEQIYNSSADKAAALAIEAGTDGADWPIMDAAAREENTAFAATVLELENAALQKQGQPSVPRIRSRVRLEGGGIELDGEGTFMATESSVIGPLRNEGLSRDEIETELVRLLGVQKFIWIPGRIGLDITDCHIDAEARFIRPGVVVLCRPHARCEPVYWEVYREMRAILESATDARGRRFEIHDVDEPDPRLVKGDVAGEEAAPAASYVNFYFTNGGLVMPAFGDVEADQKAFELLQRLVPERKVRQVAVNALPRTGGVLHCVTQQVL